MLFYICQESLYKKDYNNALKSITNEFIVEKGIDNQENIILDKDLNLIKGEPFLSMNRESYLNKNNIKDFKFDKNYEKYKVLEKVDHLIEENLNKKNKIDESSVKKETENKNEINDNGEKQSINEKADNELYQEKIYLERIGNKNEKMVENIEKNILEEKKQDAINHEKQYEKIQKEKDKKETNII